MSNQMLNFLPAFMLAGLASTLLVINTLIWCGPLILLALVKVILPFTFIRKLLDPVLVAIAELWISGNKGWMKLVQRTQWDVKGLNQLNRKGWYLVNSNHQSWVDILVLQYVFNRRIPLLKFFLKQELIRVPIMGLCWWALDFPFMKRHSRAYLAKHPEMKGKDLETTKQACEKFRLIPTSVMNFLEGTRLTEEKHKKQHSPFKHLLKPKSGGIAFAINAMGDQFDSLLNVTIVYPDGIPSFVDCLSGKLKRVVVQVEEIKIPEHFATSNYGKDAKFRAEFHQWVHQLWSDKDELIENILNGDNDDPSRQSA